MSARRSAVVAACLLALTACRPGAEPEPAPGPSPDSGAMIPLDEARTGADPRAPEGATTPPADGTAPPDSALPADTAAWTAGIVDLPPTGGIATLVSVRAAKHEGFDRVVWELSGPAPGVHVEYVDRPVRRCGSGEPVSLPGDAWLEVRLEPAQAHTVAGRPTMDERRRRTDLPVVLEIVQTCDFEGVVTWVLATRSPERFHLARLHDPTRVVVDLRHGAR